MGLVFFLKNYLGKEDLSNLILLIIVTFFYFLFFLWLLSGFDFLYNENSNESNKIEVEFISIIISVKNEESNLHSIIKSLQNQTISNDKYEIIIANDQSSDKTLDILNSYKNKISNLEVININETPEGWSSKKWALNKAIEHSKGSIILQTDGDCVPEDCWISNMVAPFKNAEIGFVSGFTPLNQNRNNFIDRIIFFENFAQDSFNAACFGKQLTISCVGRSIAFRKKYFKKINGYQNMKEIESGDDDLLMHHIVYSNSCQIKYVISKNSHVYSDRPKTINGFINQRLRFASKGQLYYTFPYISNELKLILPLLYLANLCVVISLLIFINNPVIFFIIPYILKTVSDFLLLYMFSKELKLNWDNTSFFILTLLHPFYILFFSTIGPFKKVRWK